MLDSINWLHKKDHATTRDRLLLQDSLDRASRIVSAWPEWKRGILQNSGKSTLETPRQVVSSSEDNGY